MAAAAAADDSDAEPTSQLIFFQDDNRFAVRHSAASLAQMSDWERMQNEHLWAGDRYDNNLLGETLKELVVWGGCVANCGEDSLSRLVDSRHAQLQSVVYAPATTKGGVLIRPKYHAGDRGGQQDFPKLDRMAIRLLPGPLLPWQYGWRTPALSELTLLIDPWDLHAGYEAARTRRVLASWLRRAELPEGSTDDELRANCPQLRRVHVALCHGLDATRAQTRLLTLSWPRRTPWAVERLLHLVATKPDPQVEDDSAAGRCHNALRQALPLLLPLLSEPGWACHVRPAPPSTEELGQMGLGTDEPAPSQDASRPAPKLPWPFGKRQVSKEGRQSTSERTATEAGGAAAVDRPWPTADDGPEATAEMLADWLLAAKAVPGAAR